MAQAHQQTLAGHLIAGQGGQFAEQLRPLQAAGTLQQRLRLLRRLYRRADVPGRPRNAIGLLRDVPQAEMEALLLAHIEVGQDAMRQLAVQRAVAVKDYLAAHGAPADRLFLGAAQAAADAAAAAPASAASAATSGSAPAAAPAWTPHADLKLATR